MNTIDKFTGDYQFLSNFAHCTINVEGMEFPSVEHAYQALKTWDLEKREEIRTAPTSGIAKKLGRKVVMRGDWEQVKVPIMTELLRLKFSQEPFRSQLLATGGAILIEGNWWNDTFWGVCRGQGENMLGRLLMQIRETLKQ